MFNRSCNDCRPCETDYGCRPSGPAVLTHRTFCQVRLVLFILWEISVCVFSLRGLFCGLGFVNTHFSSPVRVYRYFNQIVLRSVVSRCQTTVNQIPTKHRLSLFSRTLTFGHEGLTLRAGGGRGFCCALLNCVLLAALLLPLWQRLRSCGFTLSTINPGMRASSSLAHAAHFYLPGRASSHLSVGLFLFFSPIYRIYFSLTPCGTGCWGQRSRPSQFRWIQAMHSRRDTHI